MRKIFLILIGTVFISIILMPFWYLFSPFYYQCKKVYPGMSTQQAEEIMARYLNDPSIFVTREFKMSAKTSLESPGLYMATKNLDMRCLLSYENGSVKETEFYDD